MFLNFKGRLKTAEDEQVSSQDLLVPESFELTASEMETMRGQLDLFTQLGFRFEFVGDSTVEVLAVPILLTGRDIERFVFDVLKRVENHENTEGWQDDILATMACHSAVRAGEELSTDELKVLLVEAEKVDFYLNCPHGRPVFKWFTQSEVGSWFDR